ncbi:MAG TPA: response regulator [Humisphaera sp.]
MKILLVDDHLPTVRPLVLLLSAAGHEVATAGTLRDARVALRGGGVDLLLADHGLPDGDGCELGIDAAALGVPAVALTARAYPDDVARSRVAGFATHLAKPVPVDELLATVERVGAPARAADA